MELSTDKTVRNLVYNLSEYQWSYQYSIFINVNDLDIDTAKTVALSWLDNFNDVQFRDYLRKTNQQVAILYIIRKHIHRNHPSNKTFPQFYVTFYTTDKIKGIERSEQYIPSKINLTTNYLERKMSQCQIQQTCNTLKKQALHDISLLGNKKRFTILNRKHLIKR